MQRSMKDVHLCCEGMDLIWQESDVLVAMSMYKNGFSILEMSAVFSRPHEEISVLLIDLIRIGRLEQKVVMRNQTTNS